MMLRSLVDEVVRRRMWPIPLVAILIAVAAPLLFMKSAPAGPASVVPPAAQPGRAPAGAGTVLSTSDKAATPHQKSNRKGQDPFAPPASAKKAAGATAAAANAATAAAATGSAVRNTAVITNSDGSTSTISVPAATKPSSAKKTTTAAKPKAPAAKKTTAKTATPKVTTPDPTTSSAAARSTATFVDVRFGKRMDSMIRYRVPRLQTFRAGGRVAAMFVHYSASRDVAVFAIAPSTKVGGSVRCREVNGVCRYVDIPAGKYARLTLRAADGSYTSRRLDVVSIRHLSGSEQPRPRVTTIGAATCLLKSLLQLPVSVPSITSDACA